MQCNCGKVYKQEKAYNKHIDECAYYGKDIERVYLFGFMIQEEKPLLFNVAKSKIKKIMKDNDLDLITATKKAQKEQIYKYRKVLWDILDMFKNRLLVSEYRDYIKWIFKTYPNQIFLESLRNMMANKKILFRFNKENNTTVMKRRIDDSLLFVHEHGEFANDYEFANALVSGQISFYYVLFNTYLASKWFAQLDPDLTHELMRQVDFVTKIILKNVNQTEFVELQELADSANPHISSF